MSTDQLRTPQNSFILHRYEAPDLYIEYEAMVQRRSQVSLAGGADRIPGGINLNTYSYGKMDSAA